MEFRDFSELSFIRRRILRQERLFIRRLEWRDNPPIISELNGFSCQVKIFNPVELVRVVHLPGKAAFILIKKTGPEKNDHLSCAFLNDRTVRTATLTIIMLVLIPFYLSCSHVQHRLKGSPV
jgi:hypothetical protein